MTDYSSAEFWKGAPEGATHYMPETDSSHAVWVMVSGNTPLAWLASGDSRWEIDRSLEEDREYLIPRPAQPWSGDGLPPVGTECECQDNNLRWKRGVIVHAGTDRGLSVAVMQCADEILWGESGEFRPIKTPAQIAAEEREATIQKILMAANPVGHMPGYTYQLVSCLYDAGLRFTEGSDK